VVGSGDVREVSRASSAAGVHQDRHSSDGVVAGLVSVRGGAGSDCDLHAATISTSTRPSSVSSTSAAYASTVRRHRVSTTTRLASRRAVVFPLELAIDRTGRIFVPWRNLRVLRPT
jgi:hypothetical protein